MEGRRADFRGGSESSFVNNRLFLIDLTGSIGFYDVPHDEIDRLGLNPASGH